MDPYCSNIDSDRRWIYAGERTPTGDDWDTFRVESNALAYVRAQAYGYCP